MSAHSFLNVGDALLLGYRDGYHPQLAAVFAESELAIVEVDASMTGGGIVAYGYESRVGLMRDRLQILGFTAERATAELDHAIHERRSLPEALAREYELEVPVRSAVIDQLRALLHSTGDGLEDNEPDIFNQLDPRVVLRLALDQMNEDSAVVRLDLDDLGQRGLLVRGAPITEMARLALADEVSRDSPLVVLTEGSSDSQLLTAALEVTHPHLVDFLRFMDFSVGAPGGAGDMAKLVRAFVGAGIANRVVVIADNDTAGRDALHRLGRERLPDNYRILHYPNLPLLRRYPTLGPQSRAQVFMDVNGLAGSIEMYLGRDALTFDGELLPVQWAGYVEAQEAYQGALSKRHKALVQDSFRAKVRQALADPEVVAGQDWTGVQAIVGTILRTFDETI